MKLIPVVFLKMLFIYLLFILDLIHFKYGYEQ